MELSLCPNVDSLESGVTGRQRATSWQHQGYWLTFTRRQSGQWGCGVGPALSAEMVCEAGGDYLWVVKDNRQL